MNLLRNMEELQSISLSMCFSQNQNKKKFLNLLFFQHYKNFL